MFSFGHCPIYLSFCILRFDPPTYCLDLPFSLSSSFSFCELVCVTHPCIVWRWLGWKQWAGWWRLPGTMKNCTNIRDSFMALSGLVWSGQLRDPRASLLLTTLQRHEKNKKHCKCMRDIRKIAQTEETITNICTQTKQTYLTRPCNAAGTHCCRCRACRAWSGPSHPPKGKTLLPQGSNFLLQLLR